MISRCDFRKHMWEWSRISLADNEQSGGLKKSGSHQTPVPRSNILNSHFPNSICLSTFSSSKFALPQAYNDECQIRLGDNGWTKPPFQLPESSPHTPPTPSIVFLSAHERTRISPLLACRFAWRSDISNFKSAITFAWNWSRCRRWPLRSAAVHSGIISVSVETGRQVDGENILKALSKEYAKELALYDEDQRERKKVYTLRWRPMILLQLPSGPKQSIFQLWTCFNSNSNW